MIKKRKGWDSFIKPSEPVAPRKPEPTMTFTEEQVLYEHSGYCINLSDIPVPEGQTLSDITVSASADEDGDITFEFSLKREVTKPNLNYDRELKIYKEQYEKWKLRKAEHKIELKEWKAWKEQEDKAALDARLKHAEQLLRAHGRLSDTQ